MPLWILGENFKMSYLYILNYYKFYNKQFQFCQNYAKMSVIHIYYHLIGT